MSAERISTTTMPNPGDVRRMQEAHAPAADDTEAAVIYGHQIEVHEVPSVATIVVTRRQRGGASRPQGPPENSSANGVIVVGAEKNIELPDSAKPVATTSMRGGAERAQGPSKQAEAAQQLDREERKLRVELGSRAVERVGADYVRTEAARRVKSKASPADKYTSKAAAAAPKHRKQDTSSPLFDQISREFSEDGRDVSNSLTNHEKPEPAQPKHRKGDAEPVIAKVTDEVPEGFPADIWAGLSADERERATESWGKMSDDDRTKAFNKRIIPPMPPKTGRHKQERVSTADRIRATFASESKTQTDDKEKNKKRRFRRAIGALVLVAAAVGITAEVVDDMHQSDGTHTTTNDHKQHKQKIEKNKVVASKYHQEALRLGDTYWGDTERAHPHASEAKIHELVAKELKQDGLTWEDARHLPVGTRVSIR